MSDLNAAACRKAVQHAGFHANGHINHAMLQPCSVSSYIVDLALVLVVLRDTSFGRRLK